MLKRFVIKKNERGVLLKDGDYERILNAGRHYVFDALGRYSVQTWKINAPMNAASDITLVDYLLQQDPEAAAANFECMALEEDEDDSRQGRGGREGGGSQRHPSSRRNRGNAFAPEHRQGDGRQPGRTAFEGAGNPRARGRTHRPHLCVRGLDQVLNGLVTIKGV